MTLNGPKILSKLPKNPIFTIRVDDDLKCQFYQKALLFFLIPQFQINETRSLKFSQSLEDT